MNISFVIFKTIQHVKSQDSTHIIEGYFLRDHVFINKNIILIISCNLTTTIVQEENHTIADYTIPHP